jgi:hypothetical protein
MSRARAARALAVLAAAALTGCAMGPTREVILVECAERVGVDPPVNFVWLGRPWPGAAYVWADGTEVTPFQQAEIDRCMGLIADTPMLRLP